MSLKKLRWTIKRHPILYKTRFKLLSRNSNIQDINGLFYNNHNFKEDIPKKFHEINVEIFKNENISNELDLVKHLCVWLKLNIKGGPGLSKPSEKTLELMLNGAGGVCSDLVQIFNNFCVINAIRVREWGCTRIPFETKFGGHSFSEIYDKTLEKWVLVDVSYCMMFYGKTGEPLSVLELFQLVRNGEKLMFDTFYDTKGANIEKVVDQNYFDLKITPFLVENYSNKIYDRYLKYTGTYLPVFVIHFIIYLTGKSYYYYFPIDDYKKMFNN